MADVGPIHGWNNPTLTTGTEANWATATSIFLSDDSDAVFSGSAQENLHVEGFSFALPDDVIIRGIEVSVEAQSTASRTLQIQLTKNGVAVTGSSKTQALTSSDVIYRLGGATDLWSATDGLSVGEVNAATFGVFITDSVASASDITIDHVMMRVYIDGGIRARWDVDFTEKQITHIDVIMDYDGGAGGTAPTDGDLIYNSTPAAGGVGRIIRSAPAAVLVAGSLQMGETHDGTGELVPTWDDADLLEVCSYVDFDTEANGGLDESDIGAAFTVTGGTGTRTGVIRHVDSNGTAGRMWWDVTGQGGTAFTGDESIQISAVTVADASAAEAANAWSGVVNTAGIVPSQGYVSYDGEAIKIEASSGLERIRDANFQHNVCIYGQSSNTTAMVVHDFEDPNDSAVGRLYLADIDGSGFTDDEVIVVLYEQDYDAETADWDVGDVVGDAGSPTDSFTIQRLIDNGDLTGTMYMERLAGAAFFADGDGLFLSGGSQQADANGATRERIGQVTANGAQVNTDVQWRMNHLYTDIQRQMAAIDGLQMDDDIPQSSQVQDAQYTSLNLWEVRHFSTRRARGGALNQHDAQGGADGDDVYTNDAHLGSLNTTNGVIGIYVAQDVAATGSEEVIETFWDAGPHDILLRNKLKNAKVDGGTRRHLARNWGDFFDWFKLSKIGGANAIPLNAADDGNNATAYTTVRDDATNLYHRIILAWASHTLTFDGGSGTAPVPGDVVMETTANTAAIVVRSPDSNASGADMHLGAHGQTLGWANNQALDLLNYFDFDAQSTQFILGEAIENSGDTWNATVRFIQQFGATRGRVWVSGESGTLVDNDTIRLDGAGATRAVADGAIATAGTWAGLVDVAALSTDQTALLDTGIGGENPYRMHAIMDSATVTQLYEFLKFVTVDLAGSTTDPGSLLYPDDTSKQGRIYIAASSTYPEAAANKLAPFGAKAGDLFQGARGIFISGMAAADIQNFTLLDDTNAAQVPPNFQNVAVGNMEALYNVSVFRRPVTTASLTYTAGATDSTITQGSGSFIEDGFSVGQTVDIADSTLNNGSDVGRLKTVAALTLTFEGIVLSTEGAVSSTVTGSGVNKREYTGHATNNTSGLGTFEATASLGADLPSSGFIRIVSTAGSEISSGGFEYRLAYTSYTGAIFTLSGTLPQAFDGTARVYVPYIDEPSTAGASETKQFIYSADFPVLIVARKVGFDSFTSRADVTGSGLSVNIVRAVDPIVE